ncbi:YggT family protein [Leucobacter komagatae]|uniref:YggT family protein n=1 Tax=Leucobacter komagatae TaxID=55969 RepID=A0A542Y2G6_9MICO|nr:YggT family protein [Leucobacter komagatae]TQL42269.1 YggT family protein [Leucobacter komagatae]
MEIVYIFTTVVRIALRLFVLLLWARFVLDWVTVLARGFRPKGILAIIVEAVYMITDPPIRMFRKILPPIRLGQVALDLGWFLTMFACIILLRIIPGWA